MWSYRSLPNNDIPVVSLGDNSINTCPHWFTGCDTVSRFDYPHKIMYRMSHLIAFCYQDTLTHFSAWCVIWWFSIPTKVVRSYRVFHWTRSCMAPHVHSVVPGVSLILYYVTLYSPIYCAKNDTLHCITPRKKRPWLIYSCCNWIQAGISRIRFRIQPILQTYSKCWTYTGCPDDPKTYFYRLSRKITRHFVRYDVKLIWDRRTDGTIKNRQVSDWNICKTRTLLV